ncbi:MAG: dTDP-4-dehydrorhamnose reductase [Marinifilaceae bacterium]|jgi:dTDP-4-dehydrorhamnose reductase|nr:dTDP-4-dehydrorhamnose reductase [Marinifilaceae bacterium]
MKVLITGANGQLGSEIKNLSLQYAELEFIFTDYEDLDISDFDYLEQFVLKNKPNFIINCAAYTNVDLAEKESEIAFEINSESVMNLVAVAEKYQLKLIHISTDYVFDGTNNNPYSENVKVSPIGIYGKSKQRGEQYVLDSSSESIIIRTSWLYSSFGNNFVKTMIRLGRERKEINVVADQIGTPTYANDLAKACLDIISKEEGINKNGKIYHFSNLGLASWYDFAVNIMTIANLDCKVNPISTDQYPTIAKRPKYSVLDKSKIMADFNIEIPYWRDSLINCLKRMEV